MPHAKAPQVPFPATVIDVHTGDIHSARRPPVLIPKPPPRVFRPRRDHPIVLPRKFDRALPGINFSPKSFILLSSVLLLQPVHRIGISITPHPEEKRRRRKNQHHICHHIEGQPFHVSDTAASFETTVPHSGHRSPLSRMSYPHRKHRPRALLLRSRTPR